MGKRRDWVKVGEIVEKIKELGLSYAAGAKRFGIKPELIYDYNRKKNHKARGSNGASARATESSKKRSPAALPPEVEELICSYRRKEPTHGFKRIQDLLKTKYLIVVSRKQIRKVLKEAGLLESCNSSFDQEERPRKGDRRFEGKYPGEFWQMDVTYVYIRKVPVLYLIVVVDDYSRYCVAAELCRDQRAETLIAVLHNAASEYGPPENLLTDQGSGFYSWSGEQTRFQEYLDDQGIEHIVADPHSPQSQGKVERFFQTIRTELLRKVKFSSVAEARERIQKFLQQYNLERPHQGIQSKRPTDRFHGVVDEIEQAESKLAGADLDPSRGYMVYKVGNHRVCVLRAAEGLEVYLDGKLLKEAENHGGSGR